MKLVIPICIVGILLLISFGAVAEHYSVNEQSKENLGKMDFTHTILGEYGTATWCGYCRYAHGALKEIYAEGQYPFYYISLVDDKNPIAAARNNEYNLYGFPTLYFDGGFRVDVGAGSVPAAKATYINSIIACGNRVVEDIDIDLGVTWLGGTNMEIEATVENNEAATYGGHIRVYITEIVSSMGWYDSGGQLYTFPLLDYAFNEPLSINAGDSWTDTTTWDGTTHGFPTITETNIMVIAAVFNDAPHQGYSYPPSGYPFTAYYVDEVIGATPGSGVNNPPDPPRYPYPSDGGTNIPENIQISWTGSDPDNDDLTYDVYFGTTSPPPKIVSNQSETSYAPENLVNLTTYYWQIVAWDEHGESTTGPIWSFTTTSNYPPDKPNITGPPSGNVGEDLEYTFIATDPNGDSLYYYISWGDGSAEEWIGPLPSGEKLNATHQWSKSGPYIIKAKVKDQGAESPYAMLEITIPRYRLVIPSLIQKFLGKLPIFQILKNFLQ